MTAITPMKTWMRAATKREKLELADAVGTKSPYLYHLAGGFRRASPDLAIAIERKAKEMHEASGGRLPLIYRTDLSPACCSCEFAARCLGPGVVVRGAFDPARSES